MLKKSKSSRLRFTMTMPLHHRVLLLLKKFLLLAFLFKYYLLITLKSPFYSLNVIPLFSVTPSSWSGLKRFDRISQEQLWIHTSSYCTVHALFSPGAIYHSHSTYLHVLERGQGQPEKAKETHMDRRRAGVTWGEEQTGDLLTNGDLQNKMSFVFSYTRTYV